MKKRWLAAVLLLPLAACQRSDAGGPTEIEGKIFIFNYRLSTAVYEIALRKSGAIPEGSVVSTDYENPAGGPPIAQEMKIFPFWEKIALESPPLHCVVKDRPYHVTIRILGPDRAEIQKLETTVISSLDQSILAAKPLVVGPAYDKNPEIYGANGKADYAPEACGKTKP